MISRFNQLKLAADRRCISRLRMLTIFLYHAFAQFANKGNTCQSFVVTQDALSKSGVVRQSVSRLHNTFFIKLYSIKATVSHRPICFPIDRKSAVNLRCVLMLKIAGTKGTRSQLIPCSLALLFDYTYQKYALLAGVRSDTCIHTLQ